MPLRGNRYFTINADFYIQLCVHNNVDSIKLTFSDSRYLSVLEGALVSCTILLPDKSTVGLYFHLEVTSKNVYMIV